MSGFFRSLVSLTRVNIMLVEQDNNSCTPVSCEISQF